MRKRILLLGSGELGLGITGALKKYGAEIVACDSYHGAPAARIADDSAVFNMKDGAELRSAIQKYNPDVIIPEVEAIATEVLREAEKQGITVVPSATAVEIAMNRGCLRQMATDMGIRTSRYEFVSERNDLAKAVAEIGYPCVVKPLMSSSGRGMSLVRSAGDIERAYSTAVGEGRVRAGDVIVEELIEFDTEFTLLTVRTPAGTLFCKPIEHIQKDGDYRYSWQPADLSEKIIVEAETVAGKITDKLGGYGVFGVEFFVKGDILYFNEASPRPHDTGMVTMLTQTSDEFDLHARLALGLPVKEIKLLQPGYSAAIVVYGDGDNINYEGIDEANELPGVRVHIFGKPAVHGHRRMGVILAPDMETLQMARRLIKVTVSGQSSQ